MASEEGLFTCIF